MLDFISTKQILPDDKIPPEILLDDVSSFTWKGLDFRKQVNSHSYRATKTSLDGLQMGNLDAVFRDGKAGNFYLSNSLHKVAHSGANHTDFTLNELEQTIDYISDTLDIDFAKAVLRGRFEFGVNIEVENPTEFYQSAQFYRNKKSFPMEAKGCQYGTKFCFQNQTIKMYSPFEKGVIQKTGNPEIQDNIIRFEIATKAWYLRQKKKFNLSKVEDLTNKDNLHILGGVLTKSAQLIKFITMPPIIKEIQDEAIWQLFINAPNYRLEYFRKNQKSTFYRYKKTFDKLQSQCKENTADFGEKVNSKWCELMAA